MAKFCNKCGSKLKEDSKFCSSCGNKIPSYDLSDFESKKIIDVQNIGKKQNFLTENKLDNDNELLTSTAQESASSDELLKKIGRKAMEDPASIALFKLGKPFKDLEENEQKYCIELANETRKSRGVELLIDYKLPTYDGKDEEEELEEDEKVKENDDEEEMEEDDDQEEMETLSTLTNFVKNSLSSDVYENKSLNEINDIVNLLDEEIKDVNIINDIRERINKWGNDIPFHDLKNLGDLIEIKSVVNKPVFATGLITSIDNRILVPESKPYEKESLPDERLKANNIDLWEMRIDKLKDFQKYSKKIDYEKTRENKECTVCKGEGKNRCNNCRGNGRVRCSNCNGRGEWTCRRCGGRGENTCSSCDGKGWKRKSDGTTKECWSCSGSGRNRCGECGGSGIIICSTCRGAKELTCRVCYGDGEVTCKNCKGKRSILHYLSNEINIYNEISSDFINLKNRFGELPKLADEIKNIEPKIVFWKKQNRINQESLAEIKSELVKNTVSDLILDNVETNVQSNELKNENKILLEALEILRYDCFEVNYKIKTKEYKLYLLGEVKKIISYDDPIKEVNSDYLKNAEKFYLASDYSKAYNSIFKSFLMNEAFKNISDLKSKLPKGLNEKDFVKHLTNLIEIDLMEFVKFNRSIVSSLEEFVQGYGKLKGQEDFEERLKSLNESQRDMLKLFQINYSENMKMIDLLSRIIHKIRIKLVEKLYLEKNYRQAYINAKELYVEKKEPAVAKYFKRARLIRSYPLLIINTLIAIMYTSILADNNPNFSIPVVFLTLLSFGYFFVYKKMVSLSKSKADFFEDFTSEQLWSGFWRSVLYQVGIYLLIGVIIGRPVE